MMGWKIAIAGQVSKRYGIDFHKAMSVTEFVIGKVAERAEGSNDGQSDTDLAAQAPQPTTDSIVAD